MSHDRASSDAPVKHVKSYGDYVPGQDRQPAVSRTESMLIT